MFRKTLITAMFLLSLFLLSACGNADTESDTSTDNDSDTTTTTDSQSAEDGINANITGDVELTIEDGTYISTGDDGTILLWFMQSMATMTSGVTIRDLPYPESVPVTYDLVSDDGVTGQFEFENDAYAENVSGTITIDTFGETMSGTYSFTADRTTEDGETLNVSVEGSFSDVPVPEQSE